MAQADCVLSWVHFGDLHVTGADEQSLHDLRALVAAANRSLAGRVDFALLPGDNANEGTEAQYRLVRQAVAPLHIPLHILPGDHDFQAGSLAAFHAVLGAAKLPHARVAAGHRCLFLDIVSAGRGGPDFRLDESQLDWLERELDQADAAGERVAVFMHAYPADLRAGAERLRALLAAHRVACVDMGHTHYNELANDGRTIFMATRSTGQIEEGPVGLSVSAIDAGVVSWRFAPLAEALTEGGPLPLITRPADRRLIVDPASPDQVLGERMTIRAKIWGAAPIRRVWARIDGGPAIPLAPEPGPALWRAMHDCRHLAEGEHTLRVEAEDTAGRAGGEAIAVLVDRSRGYRPPARHADGSDRDALGAWPEKGLLGTQLGPNRNGRAW